MVSDLIFIEITSLELNLRASKSQYAHKLHLSSFVEIGDKLRTVENGPEISVNASIKVAHGSIKDCSSNRKEDKDYYIDLEERGWSKEPCSLWGEGGFAYNRLHLSRILAMKVSQIIVAIFL
jgi:hypothetical protein